MSNIINAIFDGSRRKAITCPLFQYDYGQILKISGIELPASYQVHFSNTEDAGVSKTMLGDADGVQIPDEYLLTGEYIYAFVYLHETEDDGETEYVIEIPVIRRPVPSEETPTPAEQSLIDQLLEQLNQGVEAAEAAADQAGAAAETAVAGMIDDTLTIQGKAADAKATGDEITQLKSDFNGVFETVSSANKFSGNLSVGYMNLTGGINANADYAHTDKIPVSSTTFVVTADNIINSRRMNVPLRFLTAFDENGNALSAYGQQNVGTSNSYIDTDGASVITLDASVKYVVLSIYKPNDKYKNICVSFDTSFTGYVPYGETLKLKADALPEELKESALHKYLSGKSVAVFGDSIMYGAGSDSKGAVDLLAEKYGMSVYKYCVSGSTMGIRTDSPSYTVDEVHHIAKQVRNAITAGINPDLIVFNGGTNDIGGQIPIGEMSEVYTEPSAEDLFANGFEMVAYLLKKNFVGVPTIYMRAHNMSSRTYTGQVQYGELGNKIAEKWGIRNVDMYKRMNTQLAEYRTAYLADYTHPNTDGYNKYYIPALEDFIFTEII